MKQCCWCISLEVGGVFSAIIFLVISVVEVFMGKFIFFVEVERAVVILHAFIFMAGALMLLIGILAADYVCIYLCVLFGFGAMLAKTAALVVFLTNGSRETPPIIPIVVYAVGLFLVHFYVILLAWSIGNKLWHRHHHNIHMSVTIHRWGHHHHHPVMGM